MRQPSCLLLASVLTSAAAADPGANVTVERYGNALVVTAPRGSDASPILARLTQRITVDIQEQPLAEAADQLARLGGVNLVVDNALRLASKPVTLKVQAMDLGTALDWLARLGGAHLGFAHGALYLAEQPLADEAETRFYDISDLASPMTNYPGPELDIPQPGGQGTRLLPPIQAEVPRQSVDDIADLVRKLIAAETR